MYIRKLCDANNIKYFLASGTLLGAVKYNGYIPWDDDIDICLLRRDYLKLIEIIEKDKSPDFKVLTVYNTKDYYYPYAKLVSKKTKLLDNAKEIKELGVFIDIFPMDYFNDDINDVFKRTKFLRNLVSKRMKIKNNIIKSNLLKKNVKKVKYKFFKDCVYEIANIISLPLGYNYLVKLLDKILMKNDSGKFLAILYKDIPKIFRAELFDNICEYVFEGYSFTSVSAYDEYLTSIYGKYMMDLPKSMQCTHHQLNAFWRSDF